VLPSIVIVVIVLSRIAFVPFLGGFTGRNGRYGRIARRMKTEKEMKREKTRWRVFGTNECERAFRWMVHYQGQYPGCSTTLLTISANCYTLYLPSFASLVLPLIVIPALAHLPGTLSPLFGGDDCAALARFAVAN